jgi:hypothetical protein
LDNHSVSINESKTRNSKDNSLADTSQIKNNKSDYNKPLSFQNASSKISSTYLFRLKYLKSNQDGKKIQIYFQVLKGYSTVELLRVNGSQFGLTIAGMSTFILNY